MDPSDQGSGASSLPSGELGLSELPNDQNRSRKRQRTASDEQGNQLGRSQRSQTEVGPPVTNGRIFSGQIGDGQRGLRIEVICPQHTEESFRKYTQDQMSAIVPAHRQYPLAECTRGKYSL